MTGTTDNGRNPSAASAWQDRGLNPNWLKDHHAHQERLVECLHRPLTPPRPQVIAAMADVARGKHDYLMEELLGAMLRTTPKRLFAARPDVRDLVRRVVAEQVVEPDSEWHVEAMDHLEARTRPPIRTGLS